MSLASHSEGSLAFEDLFRAQQSLREHKFLCELTGGTDWLGENHRHLLGALQIHASVGL